jgi:hypothetical protein
MIKVLVAVLAASSPAFAELSVTAPIGTTTCTGGQTCQVSWEDNHTGVSLAQQGNCTIALYTGGAQQQTFLQPIVSPNSVNVSTTASVEFTVDPTIGPNGSDYFIRFSSTSLANPTSAGNPYLSFSAKFTLAGMSGTFNQTVLNQIASASSAAASTPAASAPTVGATTTHLTVTTHATTSAHTTTTTHSGAGLTAGVSGVFVAGAALVAGVAGLF